MGSYPSADLAYGIDLGLDEEVGRHSWFTDELEEEHGSETKVLNALLKDVRGVGHLTYGNSITGYTGLILCTQSVHAYAYDAVRVGIDQLTGTVEDDARLRAAWAVLYPDRLMPEPEWLMAISYC